MISLDSMNADGTDPDAIVTEHPRDAKLALARSALTWLKARIR